MAADPNLPLPPPPARSGSGTVIVGVVAVAALGLGLYLFFNRVPAAKPVVVGSADPTARVTALETTVSELEKRTAALEANRGSAANMSPSPAALISNPTPASASTGNPGGEVQGPFDVIDNPNLKGRLGRITVTFPAETKVKDSRIDIYRAGNKAKIKTEYGNVATELVTATYDVEIDGQKVAGVGVESRRDTRIAVGVLRLHGAKDTRVDILASGTKTKIFTVYGEADVGLPAGSYDLLVSGQTETVTIKDGVVTEF
ncbi:MAG: uncharacterized protein JWM35_95 [Verrucomicrobia bacterium]|nr:uncharacterized protein [Verrucomicrobiota bacterium]